MTDIEKTLIPKKYTNPTTKISIEYHKNLKTFFQTEANKLLKHQLYNFKIKLKSEKQSLFDFLYKIFQNELKCLRKYLNEYLVKDFI
jgi:hypothetical protein